MQWWPHKIKELKNSYCLVMGGHHSIVAQCITHVFVAMWVQRKLLCCQSYRSRVCIITYDAWHLIILIHDCYQFMYLLFCTFNHYFKVCLFLPIKKKFAVKQYDALCWQQLHAAHVYHVSWLHHSLLCLTWSHVALFIVVPVCTQPTPNVRRPQWGSTCIRHRETSNDLDWRRDTEVYPS